MLNNATAVDRVFRALGDPTRRAIVERLSRGSASAGSLAGPLEISLAAVMQHLQVLQDCGIVRTEKVGRVRSCHIQSQGLQLAERWIADRRAVWERRFDRLGELLESETPAPRARATRGTTKRKDS